MNTWSDLKKELKAKGGTVKEDIERIEMMTELIGAIIEKRIECGYSQRELAEMCGLPHSSVARIEAGRVSPNIDTLIRIIKPLGLKLTITTI